MAFAQLPAFPGAEGFGKFATGARGGTVYHVTNLNDSGAGSFRDACSVSGRTIVFDVGGVINYSGSRFAPKSNITIAGQTAPGDGITIYGNGLSFSGANNTICRFIRVREGINGDSGSDAMGIANGHDMIFDHMSISWGRDETFSVSGNITNITIQSTIISQGLQTHSAGGLIQAGGGVSILRCLYIDNDTRNPKVKFKNEYVNNVVYDWDAFGYNMGGDSAGDSYVNAFNNYFVNGPIGGTHAFSGGNENFHIYATNNWQDSNLNGVLDGAVIPLVSYGDMDWTNVPFAYPITNAYPPLTALKLVVSDTGASWKRDVVDERMFTELTSFGLLGETVNSEYEAPMNGVGTVRNGTPYPDTDQDGMPNFWESALGMATNAANNNDPSPGGGGYTRLEDYLNWLAEPHGIALTNSAVCIELRQFTRGFTNSSPAYSLANATNGTVTLINGHVALFTPTANWIGPAGFQFTVTDADDSTLTSQMNLFFTPAAQSFTPIWRGDDLTNNWSDGGDLNWFNGQSLLFPFRNGSGVLFDGTGSTGPFVNLTGLLQPSLVTFDAANNYTFGGDGALTGTMALNKTGTGTLALNGTNTFSGATTVSNGTVLVNGNLPNSVVTVKNGGTLGGNGSVSLAPILQSGAKLAPGGVGNPGTLTFSNGLTLPNAITVRLDLSDDPVGTNDQIIVNGALLATGTNYLRVTLPAGPLNNGIYPLIKYTSFTGGITNFVLINANGVLTNPPGQIAILVNNLRLPAGLKWVGNGVNNNWDNGATTNWLNGVAPNAFYFFDSPLFDDSGSTNPAANLIGALTPQSVTFNATKNYTLAGSGKISGYGPLIKTNSGTLTILTTNDYAGQTVIGGGVLSIPVLPNAAVASPVGVVEEDIDNLFFTGGTLRYTGGTGSTDRKLTLGPQGGTIEITNSGTTLTLANDISGSGILTKTGAGKLSMSSAKSYNAGTVVREGTIILNSSGGFGGGILTLNGNTNGATLQFGVNGATLNNTLNVVGTNNYTINNVNNVVSGMIGSGTLTLNTGTTFSFGANMSGFSGTIKIGTVTNPRFNGSIGSSDAGFDLGNTSTLLNTRNGAEFIYLGALIGGPNTTLQGASSANGLTTYVIGGKNLDTTFAGKINEFSFSTADPRLVAINKVGTGTLTLTGSNTYHGPTLIDGGTLFVNNTSGNGTGTNYVAVNDGGTLGGTGFIFGPVTNYVGGTISPGSNGVGQLTLKSNLFLSAGSAVNFQVGTSSNKLVVSNRLTLNGTFNVTNAAGFGAGTYTVMTYGGTLSGSLPVIGSKPANFSVTVNTNTIGQVRLVVQAQTPPVFGSIKVAGTNVMFSGNGGPTNVPFYVLTSTNIALSFSNWTLIATNQFNGSGGFSFTNVVDTNAPQSFYLLQMP